MRRNDKVGLLGLALAALAAASASPALAQGHLQGRLMGNPVKADAVTLLSDSATADQRAVFAVFLASLPDSNLDSALSLTNTLQGPPAVQEVFDAEFHDLEGTLEFFLWDEFGHLLTYETAPGSPGAGLSLNGTLAPGQTYRVLLSEILEAVDFEQHSIDFNHDPVFLGYGWVVANFDGIQGTANVTDFSTFTQATVMQPDLGTTFFDFDANAGVPLIAPPPDAQLPGGNQK